MRPGLLALALAATGASACVRSNTVACGDDTVCAEDRVCRTVQGQDRCVTQAQIAACADGTCAMGSTCHDGVCFEVACGNLLVDPGEACDDGNAVTGDGCSVSCTSNETCGNGVIDVLLPGGGEVCDDGNQVSHDGCAPGCIQETAVWQEASPRPLPAARVSLALTYDAARQRIVMFGGGDVVPRSIKTDVTGELWEGTARAWIQVKRPRVPQPRIEHALAFDPRSQRVVMFGGFNIGALGDTWIWDGLTWTTPTLAASPTPRSGHAMAYVPSRGTVVMIGGLSPGRLPIDEHWEWSGTEWTQITGEVIPTSLQQTSFAVDARTGDGLLAATRTDQTVETWRLSADGWERLATTGLPRYAVIAWDPITQRVIAYGSGTAAADQGTRSWDGAAWSVLPGAREPDQRRDLALVTRGDRVVLVGGRTGDDLISGCLVCPEMRPDIWEWTGTRWEQPASFEVPSARAYAAVAYDPALDRAMVVGGSVGEGIHLNESWWLDASGVWSPAGTLPEVRSRFAITYDQVRGEVIGFGGDTIEFTDDTFRWTEQRGWELVPVTGARPAPRIEPAMSYDSKRGTVLLFGGGSADQPYADLWQWDGATWTELATAGPPGRAGARMAYDPVHDHHVLMGGNVPGAPLEDTWIWDGQWTRAPASIPGRTRYAMAWDATRQALLIHGGFLADESPAGDTWEWTGSEWRVVPVLDAPSPRGAHVAWTARDGGIYVFGGATSDFQYDGRPADLFGERYWLRYTSDQRAEVCTADSDADGDGAAGCEDPDCALTCGGCGDGTCVESLETCEACPQDCGACPTLCGDGRCTDGEVCPGDCGA